MDILGRNLENETKITYFTLKTPFLGPIFFLRGLIHFYAPALFIFVVSNLNLIFGPPNMELLGTPLYMYGRTVPVFEWFWLGS
jgi:hypothetical protein